MFEHCDAEDRVEIIIGDRNYVKRRVYVDVGAFISRPGNVLIYHLTIDKVPYFPAPRARIQDSTL
jgi:hypothetical protein